MAQDQIQTEAPLDHVVVLEPILLVIEELLRTIAKPTIQIHRIQAVDDAVAEAFQFSPCLVICTVADAQGINPAVKLLKKIHPGIKKGNLKTMVVSRVKSAQLKQLISELGVTDYIMDPIPARTLFFKFNLQINAIIAIKKREAMLNNTTELVFKKDSVKANDPSLTFKNAASGPGNKKAALKITEDCFAFTGSQIKKIDKKYLAELEGPPPEAGSWQKATTSSPENPRHRWVPNDPNAPENKDPNTGWIYDGDEPAFDAFTNRWNLTSEKPNLAYYRNNLKQGSKIETNGNSAPECAEDSEQALKRIKEFQDKKDLAEGKLSADKFTTTTTQSVGGADIIKDQVHVVGGLDDPKAVQLPKGNQAQGLKAKHALDEITPAQSEAAVQSPAVTLSPDAKEAPPKKLNADTPVKDAVAVVASTPKREKEKAPEKEEEGISEEFQATRKAAVAAPIPKSKTELRREVMQQIHKVSIAPIASKLNPDQAAALANLLGVEPGTVSPEELGKRKKVAELKALRDELAKIEAMPNLSHQEEEDLERRRREELQRLAKERNAALAAEQRKKLKEAEERHQAEMAAKIRSSETNAAPKITAETKTFFKTLAELGSTKGEWRKSGNHFVYLTPECSDRPTDSITKMLPLWIFSGNDNPEFLGDQSLWCFLEVEPRYMEGPESLPADRDSFIAALKDTMKAWQQDLVNAADGNPEAKAREELEKAPVLEQKRDEKKEALFAEIAARLPEFDLLNAYEKELVAQNPTLTETLINRKKRKLAEIESGAIKTAPTPVIALASPSALLSNEELLTFIAGVQVMVSDAILKKHPIIKRAEKLCGLMAKTLRHCKVSVVIPTPSEFEDLGIIIGSSHKGSAPDQVIPLYPSANVAEKPHLLEGIYGTYGRQLIGYLMAEKSGERRFFSSRDQEILRRYTQVLAPYWEAVPDPSLSSIKRAA